MADHRRPAGAIWMFANVGARDVMREEQEIRPARSGGQQLLAELERDSDLAQRLQFPILEPCLRYLLQQHPDRPYILVLFGTDQPESSRHWETDTLYFAEILQRCLPARLDPSLRARLREIRVHRLTGINPALYDEALDAIDRALREMPHGEDVERAYAILAGGTPACNTALLLQGVRHYGDRLEVIYLPLGNVPRILRVGRQVIRAFQEQTALERLRRHDFAGARQILEALQAPPGLVALVDYAARRLDFDFQAARRAVDQAYALGDPAIRAFIEERGLDRQLVVLLEPGESRERMQALLRELFWNARVAYAHQRYADFLGRVYRLQEAILRFMVEEIFGLPTDRAPHVRDENQRRWEQGIEGNPILREYLEQRVIQGGQRLDWRQPSRHTYQAMLAYAVDPAYGKDAAGNPLLPEDQRKRYKAALDEVNALDPLVDLRHRTIIGHDFQGVSEDMIRDRYAPKSKGSDGRPLSPVEGLERILRMLGVDLRDDPYSAIAGFAEDYLRRGWSL